MLSSEKWKGYRMDRLDAMRVFATAVETGSLSAAGRKLGMPLATVSRKLSELEAHLASRLLLRSTRQLELTDAGRDYLVACKRILDEVADAERAAAGEFLMPRGELVVSAPILFGRMHVLPLLVEFLAANPEVTVRLLQSDRNANLLEEHVDLAVRIGPLPDSRLTALPIGRIVPIACASPDYLRRRGRPSKPSQLSTHDCIRFEALDAGGAWPFLVDGRVQGVDVASRLQANTAEAVLDAAIAGVGIARLLSYQAAPALAQGKLTRLLRKFEPASTPVSMVHASGTRMPLKLRAFLDFAAPRLRAATAA
jgi:DNA-binding transcriptional LysR family regulator